MNDIFSIFADVLKHTVNDNEIDTFDEVDFKSLTKEDLDKTMSYLDKLKENDLVCAIVGDEFIDNLKAEIQAKYDIAHEDDEKVEEKNIPASVDEQIEKLVDEYIATLDLDGIENNEFGKIILKQAKDSYINFAKFIYNK